ncbi:DUF3811 domain-containing protein [Escherichia coli]|nr:DUF3811 domain-containing protein [Escherichia coli]EJI5745589.1 DUF3811 domain-containing protein [Escherichia coli]
MKCKSVSKKSPRYSQLKKKQAYKPDTEASFNWSANTPTHGRR